MLNPMSDSMKNDASRLELIENYLTNQLDSGETREIEQQIEDDPEFAREVAWMQDLLDAPRKSGAFPILDHFQEIHERRKRIERTGRIIWMVLAAAVIAFLIYWFGPFGEKAVPAVEPPDGPVVATPPPTEPWQAYIEYRSGLQLMGDEDDEKYDRALSQLEAGQVREALPLLEAYLAALPNGVRDYETELELGKIQLSTRAFDDATATFQGILDSETLPSFQEEAKFHLGITGLARGDKDQAEKLLLEVAEQASPPWNERARRALQDAF